MRSQPFGSRRAPANWARVTQFLKWALSTFFGIHIAIYVDDVHGSEPVSTCKSAFRTIKAVCALLGLAMGPEKEPPPSCSLDLLGGSISINAEYVGAVLPERKRVELIRGIQAILKNNR